MAADYYQAMAQVERHFSPPEDDAAPPPDPAQMLALVDALREGTLNPTQAETVRALWAGILTLDEHKVGRTNISSCQGVQSGKSW